MNTTNYKQYDTRWSGLPYKDLPDNIGNNGCGMVAINNGIIEMLSQIDQTPKTMQPHCRQYACHDGTYWSAIPKMLEFYGCTEVMEHDNMASLWRELEKGDRIAIYMMNNRPGGSKQVHWSSGGHFIVSCDFRHENGLHKLYVKDSNSTSSDRNYWISYEENMRGDVSACWSGKLNGLPSPTPTPTPPGKIPVDGVGGYETVYRLQQFLNLSGPDGLIGHQRSARKKYYPALTAVSFSLWGSSNTVTALQKFLNLSGPDGILGPNTTGALQRRLRDLGYLAASEEIDAIIGPKSMRALQTALNNDFKPVTPPTPPTPTPGGDTKMIDVSEFQGSIDWSKVKADGIKAVIIRVGGRGGEKGNIYDDTRFFENMKGAYNAGLSVGIYFLTQAISAAEGKEEAEYTIRKWTESGIPISFPICIDSEDVEWTNKDGSKGYGRAHSRKLSQARRTMAIQGFAEECKRQGFASMIYASTNWLYNQVDMNVLGPLMDVWVAQWSSSCDYRGKYIIWQYSSSGAVSGIKGRVDMDWCYVDPKQMNPPTPTPTPSGGEHYPGPYPVVKYYLEPGDKGENVTRLQNYLNWYTDGEFFKECGEPDGVYGKNTLKYANKMLTDFFGASEADGKVGNKTIAKMKEYTKPVGPTPPTPSGKSYTGEYPEVMRTKKLVDMAVKLAWAKGTPSNKYEYPNGDSTKAFKVALDKAYPNHNSWGAAARVGASCDVFVGTVVRYVGIDGNYPRGLEQQFEWKPNWAIRSTYFNIAPASVSQDGDIVMFGYDGGAHALIRGNGMYYEANYPVYFGHTNSSLSRLKKRQHGDIVVLRPKNYLAKGDSGIEVTRWQDYLDWWSDGQFYKECGKGDGVFGANTDKWTKKFQTAVFGASEADGTVGQRTIQKAREVTK